MRTDQRTWTLITPDLRFSHTATASRDDIPSEAATEIREILENLRVASERGTGLARLVVTSGEFRQLLKEGWDLVKDMWVNRTT